MNWVLIIITVILGLVTVGVALYLLVAYQHPEDKNQAWFPKIVVLLGLCIAIWTVLLFPLDVANSQSCDLTVPWSSCSFTMPMEALWYAVYIGNIVVVFALVPFAMFFYEADSEWSLAKRWCSGLLWAMGSIVVLVCIVVIPYALAGYVIYDVQVAYSGVLPVNWIPRLENLGFNQCIGLLANFNGAPGATLPLVNTTLIQYGYNCDTLANRISTQWKMRASFIMYAMTIVSTVGWFLFMVFGAIGLVALPLDWIRQFIGRPHATITRSQYIDRARDLARRAKDIRMVAEVLRREEREGGKGRRWRKNFKALQNQLVLLEEDERQLEMVFPQGEDPDYRWTLTVMGFWLKLFMGLAGLAISVCWILQIILWILISPPVTPLLNTLFIDANNVFPLFGTLLFGIFVFYMQGAVIKGNFKFGLNLLILGRVHPMRPGGTIMSSFLFNTALILLATTACIQFATDAFSQYADGTTILRIYGNALTNMQGLSWLYNENVFIYCFLGFVGLTLIYLIIRGPDAWKRHKPEDVYLD